MAPLDINPEVEPVSGVFALLVHDLETQVLILALRCHIILSRYVLLLLLSRFSRVRLCATP